MGLTFQAIRNNAALALSAVFLFSAFAYGVFFSGFDKYYFAPALVMLAAVAAMALAPGFKKGWAFPAAPAAIFLLLFWMWMAASVTWSQIQNVSLIFCVTIGTLPLLFFSFVQSKNNDRLIAMARMVLLAALSLLASWACFQFLFLGDLVGDRVHHPMLNANNLAVSVAIGIFLMLPLFTRFKGARQAACGAFIAISFFAVLTTQSRGSTYGIIVCAVIFSACNVPLLKQRWKSFSALLILLVTEAVIYSHMIYERFGESHLVGQGDAEASNQNRIYLWTSGLKMLKEHPFPGTGLGSFYLVFPPYRMLGDTSDGYFLHMDPLQFGIEMGFPAIILFYAFAIAVLLWTIKALRMRDGSPAARTEIICGFSGLLVLLLNAHIDFDLYMLPSLMLAAVLLSLWYRAGEQILGEKRAALSLKKKRQAVFLVPAMALVLVVFPVWIVQSGLAVSFSGRSIAALQAGNIDAAAKYAGLALRYGPANYDRAYFIDTLWRTAILQKNFVGLDPDVRRRLFDESMALTDKTLQYNRYNVQAYNYKALLSYLAYPRLDPDGVDNALEYLEKANALDPVNFDVRMGRAKILDAQGRIQEEIKLLEDGMVYDIEKMYQPPAYFYLLAQAKRKNGQADEAAALEKQANDKNRSMQEWRQKKSAIEGWVSAKIGPLMDGE